MGCQLLVASDVPLKGKVPLCGIFHKKHKDVINLAAAPVKSSGDLPNHVIPAETILLPRQQSSPASSVKDENKHLSVHCNASDFD